MKGFHLLDRVSEIDVAAVNAIFDAHSRWVGEIPVNQRWVSNRIIGSL
jgi:hypothetical protein